MFVSPQTPAAGSNPIDAVFALMEPDRSAVRMPSAFGSYVTDPLAEGGPDPLAPPEPPPDLKDAADVQAAFEWLQVERVRLERYTQAQFEKIQKQHEGLLAQHFDREQEAALQAQEINREIQRLAKFSEALDERQKQLDERQTNLNGQEDQLKDLREE